MLKSVRIRILGLMMLGASLGACGVVQLDGRISPEEAALYSEARSVAIAQVVAFNEAGIDPLNVPEDKRMIAAVGCAAVTAGSVLISGDQALGTEIGAWCDVFQKVAE